MLKEYVGERGSAGFIVGGVLAAAFTQGRETEDWILLYVVVAALIVAVFVDIILFHRRHSDFHAG